MQENCKGKQEKVESKVILQNLFSHWNADFYLFSTVFSQKSCSGIVYISQKFN